MMNHGQLNWSTIWPQGQKTEWYAYSADTQINRCYHGLSCSYRGAGAKTSTAHYNEGRPKSHCFENKVSTVRDMDIKLDDGNMKPVCLSLGFILEVSAGHTCVLSCSQSSSLLLPQFMPLLTSLLTDWRQRSFQPSNPKTQVSWLPQK